MGNTIEFDENVSAPHLGDIIGLSRMKTIPERSHPNNELNNKNNNV